MTPRFSCRWLIFFLAVQFFGGGADLAAQPRARSTRHARDVSVFHRQHADRRATYAAALEELARDCEAKGLADAAAEIRQLAAPVDTSELRLAPLPRSVTPPLAADLPPDELHWRTQLRHQRQKYAQGLYGLSRQTLNSGHVSYAFDLLREVAFNDPDHPTARAILGYVRSGDEWLTGFEKKMQQGKRVWHDQFGWIPRDHIERYERGERYFKNKWMTAEKEAAIREDFLNCWEIETEHYLVKTNHSQERGVQLARKLEDFHALFFQLMAGFFNSPEQINQMIKGTNARGNLRAKPNVVHYYRKKAEYLDVVRRETDQPVEITRGIYFPTSGIAYFFFDPDTDGDDSTVYHEATHQLLSGSRPRTREVGMKNSFWIIEGIACYMESFRREGDRFAVGDPDHVRIQAARAHLLAEQYYIPFREFSRMGMAAFQSAPRIGKNYSQGAALVHFFMHYEDGRYREALIEHISQIYSPDRRVRESPDSLEDLTGVDAEELDRQYAEYLRDLAPQALSGPAGTGE